MRSTALFALAVVLVGPGVASLSASAAPVGAPPTLQRDGSMKMAGRDLRCGQVRNRLDHRLPSEGAAAPGILVINPRLIARMPETLRLFVFYHECGHHNVGASELGADCWAVGKGVSEGWLDRYALKQVCRSFGNMPETPTHPSSRRRCRNLDVCFGRAIAREAKKNPSWESVKSTGSTPSTPAAADAPKLVSGPRLVGSGSVDDKSEKSTGEAGMETIAPIHALR